MKTGHHPPPPFNLNRKCLLFILILELLSTIERQIFDFLGYMWLPIALNFLNILLVIFGLFGLFENRRSYIASYIIWTLLVWISWNVFLICYYKNLGILNHSTMDVLSLGTGSFSWWFAHGLGCVPEYHFNNSLQEEELLLPSFRPSSVNGCKIHYEDVEVCHAGIQVCLGALGLLLASLHAFLLSKRLLNEPHKRNMYSIEYSPKGSAPMTPRRVKRRQRSSSSNHARNTTASVRFNQNRSSHRHNRLSSSSTNINPVNRLIDRVEEINNYEQSNSAFDSSRPNSLYGTMIVTEKKEAPYDVNNKGGTTDRCPSSLTNYSNFHQQRRIHSALKPIGNGNNLLTQQELLISSQQDSARRIDEAKQGQDQEEDEELPLPPPPLTLEQHQPEPTPRIRNDRANYVNVPVHCDEGTISYTDTQTLYAGSNGHNHHKEYGAIPKQLPSDHLYGGGQHGSGCVCGACQRKLTAI